MIPTLVRTLAPAVEPITLDEAKAHLRVLDDDERDPEITRWITMARETMEQQTSRALITQTWAWIADRFPPGGAIAFPLSPLQSVTSVAYVDADGVTRTWPTDQYVVDPASDPPRLYLATPGAAYPATAFQRNAVTITFVAGYGDAGDAVPATLIGAMLGRIAWLFEHAGDEGSSIDMPPYPFDVRAHYRARWAV